MGALCIADFRILVGAALAVGFGIGAARGEEPTSPSLSATYQVRSGETLSEIALRIFGKPVYSKTGGLARLVGLNPELRNPDRILPGQTIRLAEDRRAPAMAEESPVPESSSNEPLPPETAASAEPVLQKSADFRRGSDFAIAPNFGFVKIESVDRSTGASAVLISKHHLGFEGTWSQRWSPDFSTRQSFSIARTAFDRPTAKSLENETIHAFGFAAGAEWSVSRASRLHADAGIRQTPYLRSVSLSTVRFDLLPIAEIAVGSEHDLLALDPFCFGIGWGGSLQSPASSDRIRAQTGYAYGARTYFRQVFGHSRAGVSISYERRKQDTSLTRQTRDDIGFRVEYSLSLGSSSP